MQNPGIAPVLEKPKLKTGRLVEGLCESKQMSTTPPQLSQETEVLLLDIESKTHQT